MFGIGFSELAIIALILVIVIRPEDMPGFFRKMGRLYGQVKSAYKEVAAVKDEFLREMDVNAAIQDTVADQKDGSAPASEAKIAESAPTPAQSEATAPSETVIAQDEAAVHAEPDSVQGEPAETSVPMDKDFPDYRDPID